MLQNKIYGLLGLARRAGKAVSGEEPAESAIRSGKAHLVLLAEDASPNTVKKFRDKCSFYGVPLILADKREVLGRSVGAGERVCVAICDEGLAGAIRKEYQANGTFGKKQGE